VNISITVRASVPFAQVATWTGPCPWSSIPPPGTEFFCCGEWGGDQITHVNCILRPSDGGPTVDIDVRTATQDFEYLEHLHDEHGFELR
jgi:hypothetical protein